MKKIIFITFILLLTISGLSAQTKKEHYIGIDLIELTTTTVNLNYSCNLNARFTPFVQVGYTIDYTKVGFDILNFSSKTPCDDIIYNGKREFKEQKGGYLKLGLYYNLRKSVEKQNFFHIGAFITGSVAQESFDRIATVFYTLLPFNEPYLRHPDNKLTNSLGIGVSIGYEFKLSDRIKMNIDYQLSYSFRDDDKWSANRRYDPFGFMPGIHYKETDSKIFPLAILAVKYRL